MVKNGLTVDLGPSSFIDVSGAEGQPMRESSWDSGVIVDKDGRQIARRNDDGTAIVDSGHGVYTTHQDGSVREEAVLRSRDGKKWEVLDLSSPLGSRPGH